MVLSHYAPLACVKTPRLYNPFTFDESRRENLFSSNDDTSDDLSTKKIAKLNIQII